MPAKSRAQARMIGYLYNKGKVSKKVLEDFNMGVKYSELPKKVKKKK